MSRLADRVRAVLTLLGPLGAGSRILLLRLIGRFGWQAVLAGMAVAGYTAYRYRTWIWAGVLTWCAAAWMHAPDPDEHTPQEQPAEPGEQPPAEPPHDPFPGMVWDLIGDAPGVHLKTIVGWLRATGHDTTCTTADVAAGLARRGIPVRASVRDATKRVNRGVHRDDLGPWLEAHPQHLPGSAPEARSNAATTPVTSGVADDATGVATPATPAD
jgi:hypothetical protein